MLPALLNVPAFGPSYAGRMCYKLDAPLGRWPLNSTVRLITSLPLPLPLRAAIRCIRLGTLAPSSAVAPLSPAHAQLYSFPLTLHTRVARCPHPGCPRLNPCSETRRIDNVMVV